MQHQYLFSWYAYEDTFVPTPRNRIEKWFCRIFNLIPNNTVKEKSWNYHEVVLNLTDEELKDFQNITKDGKVRGFFVLPFIALGAKHIKDFCLVRVGLVSELESVGLEKKWYEMYKGTKLTTSSSSEGKYTKKG